MLLDTTKRVKPLCSTPLGVTAEGTRIEVPDFDRALVDQCSTPLGVTAEGTSSLFAHELIHFISAQRLSASRLKAHPAPGRDRGLRSGQVVLNASRRHG